MSFAGSSKLKLGVIAPNSNFVPFLSGDMLTALEFGLAEARLDAEIIIGSAGYNADIKMIVPAIQQLILADRVDFIIAPINVAIIERIAGYCESQGVPLIALNLTEDPLFETSRNPFVFVNSFYLWHSAWISGYMAGQKFGLKGSAIAALHDSGYGLMFAFQLGLEASKGRLIDASVTHRNSSIEDPTAVIYEVISQNPDFIWAAYSGKEAVSFLKAYNSLDQKKKLPLVILSPTIGESIRLNAEEAFRDIWYISEEMVKSNSRSTLAEAIGREPNPYALLAYETAYLIADAVNKNNGTKDLNINFPESLSQAEFESFRGKISFNKSLSEEKHFYSYHITGKNTVIEKIIAPPLLHEQYRLACRKLTKQGWLNPYLCA